MHLVSKHNTTKYHSNHTINTFAGTGVVGAKLEILYVKPETTNGHVYFAGVFKSVDATLLLCWTSRLRKYEKQDLFPYFVDSISDLVDRNSD